MFLYRWRGWDFYEYGLECRAYGPNNKVMIGNINEIQHRIRWG